MEETLHSDEIRNTLEGESEYGSDSDYESDINTNIGKQFKQDVVSELFCTISKLCDFYGK
jgi:hypothetical protein